MRSHGNTSALVAVALLSACTSEAPPQTRMVMTDTVVVTNSGSTNAIGWRVLVAKDGTASWASGDGTGRSVLPTDLNSKLHHDLSTASPLEKLPTGSCMKSASFGTSTFITLGGDRSPDLSCPGDDAAQALKSDIDQVASILHVRNVPRTQGHDLPPENF